MRKVLHIEVEVPDDFANNCQGDLEAGGLLTVALIAMGWPVKCVTVTDAEKPQASLPRASVDLWKDF